MNDGARGHSSFQDDYTFVAVILFILNREGSRHETLKRCYFDETM